MSNHTRHPLLVDSVEKDICYLDGDGGYVIVATIHPVDDFMMGQCYYGPESMANAYVMRTAPEMYDLLADFPGFGAHPAKVEQWMAQRDKVLALARMQAVQPDEEDTEGFAEVGL